MDSHHSMPPQPVPVPGAPSSAASQQSRPTVSRNARACTVCRAVKMKCVGAEDGQQQCQRCRRSNLQCVFEKHRRGRKPGSKLSDTSKMLRRIDKAPSDLTTTNDSQLQASPPQHHQHQHQHQHQHHTAPVAGPGSAHASAALPGIHHLASSAAHLPPVASSYASAPSGRLSPSRHYIRDAEPRPDVRMYDVPSAAHRERNNFFGTVLGPLPSSHDGVAEPDLAANPSTNGTPAADTRLPQQQQQQQQHHQHQRHSVLPVPRFHAPAYPDPLSAGMLTEAEAANLFELIFQRLNGFLMLFDPSIHTLQYIRDRSPFLLTCMLAAACKFWRHDLYQDCLDLAHSYVPLAFERGWRSPEVVQAFTFLTFYPELGHEKTWAYIGHASRMAIELGMHQLGGGLDVLDASTAVERRLRERTFLVLFIQERTWASLAGKPSMLPDSNLVRSASSWYLDSARTGGPAVNDVMLCAIVDLRRIATETQGRSRTSRDDDVNDQFVLTSCNNKLSDWMEHWHNILKKFGGQMFHFSVLCIYRLQARVFVNGLGIESACASRDNSPTMIRFYTSGLSALLIPYRELAPEKLLRYGHQLITAIVAHCANSLLRALEISTSALEIADRHEKTMEAVAQTAQAYESEQGGNHDAAVFFRALLKSDVVGKETDGLERPVGDLAGALHANGHDRRNGSAMPASRTPSPEPMPPRSIAEQPLPAVFRQHPGYDFPAGPVIPARPFVPGIARFEGSSRTSLTSDPGWRADTFWWTMFSLLGFGRPEIVREAA